MTDPEPPERLSDDRLRQFASDPYVCSDAAHRSMAAELLAARPRIAELEAQLERAEPCPGDCPMRSEVGQ